MPAQRGGRGPAPRGRRERLASLRVDAARLRADKRAGAAVAPQAGRRAGPSGAERCAARTLQYDSPYDA